MADRTPRAVAEEIIAAWNRGDEPLDLGLIADDVEYVNPPGAIEGGIRRGAAGWRHAMRGVGESYEVRGLDVQQIREAGDRVAMLLTFRVRGRTSGVDAQQDQGFVFTVRDGQATRFEWWSTHREALESMGLADEG